MIVPTYNEANFLASLQAQIRGQGDFVEFLEGSGLRRQGPAPVRALRQRRLHPILLRSQDLPPDQSADHKSGADPQPQGLQNLHYTYDPVGNITQIRDDAQQTHYFNNAVVKPECLYEYDAIYQLVRATGREHAGLANDAIRTHSDLDFVPQLPHANNADAVRTYTEEYEYDLLGNIKMLRHRFQPQAGARRRLDAPLPLRLRGRPGRPHQPADRDQPARRPGRRARTARTYDYDAYGNMTRMPHLAVDWTGTSWTSCGRWTWAAAARPTTSTAWAGSACAR